MDSKEVLRKAYDVSISLLRGFVGFGHGSPGISATTLFSVRLAMNSKSCRYEYSISFARLIVTNLHALKIFGLKSFQMTGENVRWMLIEYEALSSRS
jgi:hypothetical protein